MENFEKDILAGMVIAPYLQKATALRGVKRYVGGNQFRHAFATLAILIDYHYMDSVLLKASVIHDLIEEGILSPEGHSPQEWRFSFVAIKRVQTSVRLQQDLRVNLPGCALALELLEELEELRRLSRRT